MNNWKNVWNNRQVSDFQNVEWGGYEDQLLMELIKADGFDGGSGKSGITIDAWKNYILFIKNELDVQKNDSLFEVGCGCGAILYPFYNVGHIVGGIDYTDNFVQKAKKIMPNAEIILGDASEINNIQYDFVISNSIFFYFPNYDYASIVISKMYEKARKGIAVLDIPDLYFKELCEDMRRQQVPDYNEKYRGLEHLYYPKKWFLDFSEQKKSTSLTIKKQNITEYGYNKYRYDCFILK
jgi:hypothetical protein